MKRAASGLLGIVTVLAAGCGERTALLAEPTPEDASAASSGDARSAPLVDARRTIDVALPIDLAPGAPAACRAMGFQSTADVESRFIAPRCGRSECHATVFPPRGLSMPANIRRALVGVRGQTLCKTDFYVDRGNPARSYLLAKISATGTKVTCPSGGEGGNRMPNVAGAPTMVAPRLSQAELDCLTWWVNEVAKL